MDEFNGLGTNLGNIYLLSDARTRTITPENFTGEKGKSCMAEEGTGQEAARKLGKGWKISPSIHIKPGEVFTLADIQDCGAIVSMWFGGVVDRNYILRIYWDNQENPSVECPLADFFGYGWGETMVGDWMKGPFHPLISEPVVVAPNKGLNCFWQMPFRARCLMTIENRTDVEYMCYYQINYTLTEMPEKIGYFHAQYRQAKPIKSGEVYTIVDQIEGEGQFVGTALSVGLNGDARWWGEGEVKFYIDEDEDYPTICTTGTEDYFGGSFNWEVDREYVTYNSPYMGMYYYRKPDGLYNIQPRFSMYRWHLPDPIRFKKGLSVTIQDLGWTEPGLYLTRRDDFYSVAFWYQTLPTAIFPKLPDIDAIRFISEY